MADELRTLLRRYDEQRASMSAAEVARMNELLWPGHTPAEADERQQVWDTLEHRDAMRGSLGTR